MKVGSGFWRQIGILGFGVGVAGNGGGSVAFGVGGRVGSGFGGTRGSGKRGSAAAESDCERFQSGPYGCGEASAPDGSGVGRTDCSCCCSVACCITRSPMRCPTATAISRMAAPAARTIVGNFMRAPAGE